MAEEQNANVQVGIDEAKGEDKTVAVLRRYQKPEENKSCEKAVERRHSFFDSLLYPAFMYEELTPEQKAEREAERIANLHAQPPRVIIPEPNRNTFQTEQTWIGTVAQLVLMHGGEIAIPKDVIEAAKNLTLCGKYDEHGNYVFFLSDLKPVG